MKREVLKTAVSGLSGQEVLIIGDLMLDHYVSGGVDRISPEAPVPVVRVTAEHYLLGGAGNVARNICALGGSPKLIGIRGDDDYGKMLEQMLGEACVPSTLVTDPERPTTRKTRIMASQQQIVRIDREDAAPLSGPVVAQILDVVSRALDGVRVVILSDYGKGVICREFMAGFMELVAQRGEDRPRVLVDPKTVNYDLYRGVDLLTPNTKEAGEGAGMTVRGQKDVLRAGAALFERLNCAQLLITLGPDGMAFFDGRESVRHIPTFARKVFDVTGAGDTVIATLALGLAAGYDPLLAATLANYAAGISVGQVGAAVATPQSMAEAIAELPEPEVSVWAG